MSSFDISDVVFVWPVRVVRQLLARGAWRLLAIDLLLALVTWWHGGLVLKVVLFRFVGPFVGPPVLDMLAPAQTVAGLFVALLGVVLIALAGVRTGREHPYAAAH